jgi:hypothetical protein
MHEVRRENGACSHRTSQAGLRSAHIRVHKVQQPQFRATVTPAVPVKQIDRSVACRK